MGKFRTGNKKGHVTPFTKFKFPEDKGKYAPSTIEFLNTPVADRTESGHITWNMQSSDSIESTGVIVNCYAYLATGRFFSTAVAPSEYGDADASDELLAIIYLDEIPEEHFHLLKTGNVVKLTVAMYTHTELYRITTGNPYSDHVEVKLTPLKL